MSLFNEVEVDKSSFQPLKKQNASFYGAYDNKINDYATSAIVSSEIKNATSNNVLISKKDLDSGLLPLPDNYRSAAHASLPIVGKIFTSNNSSTVKFDRFINSNVTYTFSASSVRLQTGNDFSPYNAFNGYENDNVTSSYWISSNAYDLSGFYIGTNSTNNISGEWIQVQLSIPAIVCSYGVLNGEGYLRIPFNTNTRKYSLMASNGFLLPALIDSK